MVIFVIEAIVIILGTIATLYFFIAGLSGKKGFRKAMLSLMTVFITLLLLTILDFGTAPKVRKEKMLVAKREAPITGVELVLYSDSTFSLGNLRKITKMGVYRIRKDTLLLEVNTLPYTSFLIKHRTLEELGGTGISALDVKLNKLTQGSH